MRDACQRKCYFLVTDARELSGRKIGRREINPRVLTREDFKPQNRYLFGAIDSETGFKTQNRRELQIEKGC